MTVSCFGGRQFLYMLMHWVKRLGIEILSSLGFGTEEALYELLWVDGRNEYGLLKYSGLEAEWEFELANYGEPQGPNRDLQRFYFWGRLVSAENKDELGFVGFYKTYSYELKSLYEIDAYTTKNIVRSVEK